MYGFNRMDKKPLGHKIAQLPTRPGVYMLKDATGETLYIGKANSLRTRVRSHFHMDSGTSPKNREMLRRVTDVETIVVGSEMEALLLEANLIREVQPRFNIRYRDDKRYPYIKVTVQEDFPRVLVTRRVENDGAGYFGPYTDVTPMRQALELIRRLFTVRSCRYALPAETPARPCLDYHIGRCLAPCAGLQTASEYGQMIDEILLVLRGRIGPVRQRISREMKAAAHALDFEKAASMRDALNGLTVLENRQRVLDVKGGERDVLGLARDGDRGCAVLLRIRGGVLLGREAGFFENLQGESDTTFLAVAVKSFYLERDGASRMDVPPEITLASRFRELAVVEEHLRQIADGPVRLSVARRGTRLRMVELANENARHLLEEQSVLLDSIPSRADEVLYQLQELLGLKVVPRLTVCFDISHHQGQATVGSAIVFESGKPKKGEYRRFRVRGEAGNDDYRSMRQVIRRYFQRRLAEELPLADLILVDGGRGQLSAARNELEELGLKDLAVGALAKRDEALYLPGRREALRLPRNSEPLRLLQRIRNEAHRFAQGYNRKLERKRMAASKLTEIPGIGPARSRALLRGFGSLRSLRESSPRDIATVTGISEQMARRLLQHLKE